MPRSRITAEELRARRLRRDFPEMSAEELRSLRERWGFSQPELARLVGLSLQAISGYEADPASRESRRVPGPMVLLLELLETRPELRSLLDQRAEERHARADA
jgi:DNA-binding transcriptional regulator YiaG